MKAGGPCMVCKLAGFLAGLGALNWGLVGILKVDLVAKLLGEMTAAARAVYAVIGLGGLITWLSLAKVCPCTKEGCEPKSS